MTEFPSLEQLRKGSLLRTLTHAIWVVKDPSLAYEIGWAGTTYLVQNSMGGYGAVTFKASQTIGAFFDVHSSRNPLKGAQIRPVALFQGASEEVRKLANEETLKYMLKEYDGLVQPAITAAFWSNKEILSAAESWDDVVKHGAYLVAEDFFTDLQEGLDRLNADYDLSSFQVALARDLFNQKMKKPHEPFLLNDKQIQALVSQGTQGEKESRELLKAIGVIWP
jgi:hypothetical protein